MFWFPGSQFIENRMFERVYSCAQGTNVDEGRSASTSSEQSISSDVPSSNRPQPLAKSVSPLKRCAGLLPTADFVESNMPFRMARDGDHRRIKLWLCYFHARLVAELDSDTLYSLRSRAKHREIVPGRPFEQPRHPTDMVRMMVSK